MSCLLCTDGRSLLATVYSGFPERLKSHGARVGTVAGIMARYAPASAIPENMEPAEYQNAVRYGGLYHDIGVYLAFNHIEERPSAGAGFLKQQLPRHMIDAASAQIMIEAAQYSDGHCEGGLLHGAALHIGICAVANAADSFRNFQTAQRYIIKNAGTLFMPEAVVCFNKALDEITALYRQWRKRPPLFVRNDAAPLYKTIDRPFG